MLAKIILVLFAEKNQTFLMINKTVIIVFTLGVLINMVNWDFGILKIDNYQLSLTLILTLLTFLVVINSLFVNQVRINFILLVLIYKDNLVKHKV